MRLFTRWRLSLVLLSAALGFALVLVQGVPGAQATLANQTSYITWNMAGANNTYGETPGRRLRNADLVIYVAVDRRPAGIRLQEVCDNTNPNVTDAREKLLVHLVAQGYTYFGASTKVVSSLDCVQANWVYAAGEPIDYGRRNLPYDGDETRNIVCIEVSAFLAMTTCSTHLSTESNAARHTQAFSAFEYSKNGFFDYATYTGGDFNDTPSGASPDPVGIWYPSFYEADRFFNPPRATSGGGKIDYGWGEAPRIVSRQYAILDGRNVYSDHDLLWAPYDWQT